MGRINILDVPDWIDANLNFPWKERVRFEATWNGLRIAMTVPNTVNDMNGGRGTPFELTHFVPMSVQQEAPSVDVKGEEFAMHVVISVNYNFYVEEEHLVNKVFILMGEFFVHEFIEQFSFRNERIFDPHNGGVNETVFNAIREVPHLARKWNAAVVEANKLYQAQTMPKTVPDFKPGDSYKYKFEYVTQDLPPLPEAPTEPAPPLTGYQKLQAQKAEFRDFYKKKTKWPKHNGYDHFRKKAA